MQSHEIIALRCPSCGGGPSEPSREMPFGTEFRCGHCGITSVLIIDRALVPLSTLQTQGEKVCTSCGRVALREARFCQEGHALVQKCVNLDCQKDFSIDHKRCDFCGLLVRPPLRLNDVCQGTVTRIVDFGAFVDVGTAIGLLHISEIANHRVTDVRDELKEGEQLCVKVLGIEGNKVKLSSKACGRP